MPSDPTEDGWVVLHSAHSSFPRTSARTLRRARLRGRRQRCRAFCPSSSSSVNQGGNWNMEYPASQHVCEQDERGVNAPTWHEQAENEDRDCHWEKSNQGPKATLAAASLVPSQHPASCRNQKHGRKQPDAPTCPPLLSSISHFYSWQNPTLNALVRILISQSVQSP